jgi:hypothetical protein
MLCVFYQAAMCFVFVIVVPYWRVLRRYDIGAALLYLVIAPVTSLPLTTERSINLIDYTYGESA